MTFGTIPVSIVSWRSPLRLWRLAANIGSTQGVAALPRHGEQAVVAPYLEFSGQFNCPAQQAQVMVPRNFDTAKLLQVWSQPLRIEQHEFSDAQMFDQRYQR